MAPEKGTYSASEAPVSPKARDAQNQPSYKRAISQESKGKVRSC